MNRSRIYSKDYTKYESSLRFGDIVVGKLNFGMMERSLNVIGLMRKYISRSIIPFISQPHPPEKAFEELSRDFDRLCRNYYTLHISSIFDDKFFVLGVLYTLLNYATPKSFSFLPTNEWEVFRMRNQHRILLVLFRAKKFVRPKQLRKFISGRWPRRAMFRNLGKLKDKHVIGRNSHHRRKVGYYLSETGYEIASLLDKLAGK